jgi:AbrB family looped-hinge helix DNA binding protein
MRITTKGQVTIPKNIRELLGITPESEVEFREENGKVYLVKTGATSKTHRFSKLRGIASVKLSTDEIMELTRDI